MGADFVSRLKELNALSTLKKIRQQINRQDQLYRQIKLYQRKQDARRKIELGGLIIKAGLDDETSAVLLGLLTEAKDKLIEKGGESNRTYWHMVGSRIFEKDSNNKNTPISQNPTNQKSD